MSAQFDVHRKPGLRNPVIPFVVIVQSSRFRASSQRVVVPLIDLDRFRITESDLSPHFVITDRNIALDPLRIVHVPARALGDAIASLADQDARIINALDTLLTRAWR